jgi:hypothetical protein
MDSIYFSDPNGLGSAGVLQVRDAGGNLRGGDSAPGECAAHEGRGASHHRGVSRRCDRAADGGGRRRQAVSSETPRTTTIARRAGRSFRACSSSDRSRRVGPVSALTAGAQPAQGFGVARGQA